MALSIGAFDFSALNVTNVAAAISIQPRCANGFCEVTEAVRGGDNMCPADCPSLGWCPVALDAAVVGKVGTVCGKIGICKPATRQCSCPIGHAGEACTRCEFGYVARGAHGLAPAMRAAPKTQSSGVRPATHGPTILFTRMLHTRAASTHALIEVLIAEGRCAPTQARFITDDLADEEPRGFFGLEGATLRFVIIGAGTVLGVVQIAMALFCCWRRRRSIRLQEQGLDSPHATQRLHP